MVKERKKKMESELLLNGRRRKRCKTKGGFEKGEGKLMKMEKKKVIKDNN